MPDLRIAFALVYLSVIVLAVAATYDVISSRRHHRALHGTPTPDATTHRLGVFLIVFSWASVAAGTIGAVQVAGTL